MFLAATLGACLLLAGPCANFVPSAQADVVWPLTQHPESPQSNSSSQNSSDQPPTSQQETADQSTSSSQSSAATTAPCPQGSPTGSSPKSDCKPAKSTVAKTRKRRPAPKPVVPSETAGATGPTKTVVVRNGGTADPAVALSPGVSPQQASRETDSTNKLLAASDANLEKVSGRQLSANQQDTVKQIKSYMDQAKAAAASGDVQRAYNLAVKANLLSAELAGQ